MRYVFLEYDGSMNYNVFERAGRPRDPVDVTVIVPKEFCQRFRGPGPAISLKGGALLTPPKVNLFIADDILVDAQPPRPGFLAVTSTGRITGGSGGSGSGSMGCSGSGGGYGVPWEESAAREIDRALGDAVEKNTGVQTGFFCGVSIQDIADIILKHYNNRA